MLTVARLAPLLVCRPLTAAALSFLLFNRSLLKRKFGVKSEAHECVGLIAPSDLDLLFNCLFMAFFPQMPPNVLSYNNSF